MTIELLGQPLARRGREQRVRVTIDHQPADASSLHILFPHVSRHRRPVRLVAVLACVWPDAAALLPRRRSVTLFLSARSKVRRTQRFPPSDKSPWGSSVRIAGGVARFQGIRPGLQ